MTQTVVFDVDGTLANLDHRKHLVQRPTPNWHEFFESCDKDTYNIWVFDLLKSMWKAGFHIAIVSARHKGLWAKTVEWLNDGGVFLCDEVRLHLLRDSETDYRPDIELKKEWLDSCGRDNILFAVDDRQKVVDMWRREGVKCLQCDKWEEYKRPPKVAT